MSGAKHKRTEDAASKSAVRCCLPALSADILVATTQWLELCDLARLACCHSTLRALCTLRLPASAVDAVADAAQSAKLVRQYRSECVVRFSGCVY